MRRAGDEAGLALKDLRDLARGIHPAILTNRGLPAALDDLAGRPSRPGRRGRGADERLPDQVEAAAYFVVSECLANVDKHAQATRRRSRSRRRRELVVTVGDDGVGGAELGRRLGAAGPARTASARWTARSRSRAAGRGHAGARHDPAGGARRAARASEHRGTPAAHRRSRRPSCRSTGAGALRIRASVLGGIAALVILVVWALTGAPNAWPCGRCWASG